MVVKRRYESARRQEQARETRGRILAAARRLFVDPGYPAATVAVIAAEAGVAPQTVYAVFGSKRRLLSDLVDVSIAGDDEPLAVPERAFVAEIAALPGGRAKLRRYARHLAEVNARIAEVMLALASAAQGDPDAAAIWQKGRDERYRGMTMFATALAGSGCLRADVGVARAADVLWLAMDVGNYVWLVRERGWSTEDYERWYADTVGAVILSPQVEPETA